MAPGIRDIILYFQGRQSQKEYFDQMEEPRMLRDTQVSTVGPRP